MPTIITKPLKIIVIICIVRFSVWFDRRISDEKSNKQKMKSLSQIDRYREKEEEEEEAIHSCYRL